MSFSEQQNEQRRILDMVASGHISAKEGDELLQAVNPESAPVAPSKCPWCAEQIPADLSICPHCAEPLVDASQTTHPARCDDLTTLDKCLAIIVTLICGIDLLSNLVSFSLSAITGNILAVIGLCAGIFIFLRKPFGWTMGVIWSALQIIEITFFGEALNRQMFHLGINFNTNGIGLGLNLLAIGFLYFFLKAKRQQDARQQPEALQS